jgi:hypothetical protein
VRDCTDDAQHPKQDGLTNEKGAGSAMKKAVL